MPQADIGLIGLAVMGQNLAMNINDHGYTVAVYNRTSAKTDAFLEGTAKGSNIIGTHSVEKLCDVLSRPRKLILMVRAGDLVDHFIAQILPYLDDGYIIIDGGPCVSPTATAATPSWPPAASALSAAASPAARRARATVPRSCPAAIRGPGPRSSRSCSRLPPRSTVNPVASGGGGRCGSLCQDGAQRHSDAQCE